MNKPAVTRDTPTVVAHEIGEIYGNIQKSHTKYADTLCRECPQAGFCPLVQGAVDTDLVENTFCRVCSCCLKNTIPGKYYGITCTLTEIPAGDNAGLRAKASNYVQSHAICDVCVPGLTSDEIVDKVQEMEDKGGYFTVAKAVAPRSLHVKYVYTADSSISTANTVVALPLRVTTWGRAARVSRP